MLLGTLVVVAGCGGASQGASGSTGSTGSTKASAPAPPGPAATTAPLPGAAPSSQPSSQPSFGTGRSPDVVRIGLEASGRTLTLHVGQRLVVSLPVQWTAPVAQAAPTDPTRALVPLRTDSATGFPAAGPAVASFTATRVGTAVVTARTDAACLHETPTCLLPQQLFTVRVEVRPVPGQGAGPLPMGPVS